MYYEYFYIFLAFVFVILAADVFCYERTRTLEGMVFTSEKGRKNLFTAKLCSLVCISFVTMLIFTVADVCVAYFIMGGRLLHEPIQILEVFQTSTANIDLLTFIICCNVLRFAVLVLAICLAAAVSQISRNVFVSIIIDLAVMFGMFAAFVYSMGYNTSPSDSPGEIVFDSSKFALYEKLRGFLPACLTNPMVYFEKFDYINVANYPFTRMTTCVIVTVTASVLLALFSFVRFGNVLKFIPRKAKKG